MKTNNSSNQDSSAAISEIVGNISLASSITDAIALALSCPFVRLIGGQSVWQVFNHSLSAAIRDIGTHPRGQLLRRLIEYGHHHPDEPAISISDGQGVLSDPELGKCIEFIFSHMINRFKGELAELLALEPCCHLFKSFISNNTFPPQALLYWGETIQEPSFKIKVATSKRCNKGWFTKGADGLFIESIPPHKHDSREKIILRGVVEVKSMVRPLGNVLEQVDRHISRLREGLSLENCKWQSQDIQVSVPKPIRVIVQPSNWKLSRDFGSQEYSGQGLHHAIFRPASSPEVMIFPESKLPLRHVQNKQIEPDLWKIILPWSQEALSQAAFEMTFWYMGQIGKQIYLNKSKPEYLAYMTPEEIGLNRIKEMLRNAPLRPITDRQYKRAMWLYNSYCFGYPIGADDKEMIFLPGEGSIDKIF